MTDNTEYEPGRGQTIDCLYAWVSSDETGEGVIAGHMPGMGTIPLVGADRARIESYRDYAVETARMMGRPVYLKRFGKVDVLEALHPDGTAEVKQ